MVHRESVVGDDGSHRLLVLPCALVVLVLVLMVTACTAGDGDAVAGSSVDGGSGVDGDSGQSAVLPKKSAEESGAAGTVEGGPAEPVVTEDGRMLQPEGHTGLWFESEPSDPLEKLVYRSQRFVGQPVTLEPLGDRALLPQWEDMPDPCHPEVLRRMEELGVEVIDSGAIGTGIAICGFTAEMGPVWAILGFEFAVVENLDVYSDRANVDEIGSFGFRHIVPNEESLGFGCVAVAEGLHPRGSLVATSIYGGKESDCLVSEYSLQLGINSLGGSHEH